MGMKAVETIVGELLHREVTLSEDMLLSDIDGWDSLKSVQLILRLEEEVGRELSEEELEALASVKNAVNILTCVASASV